MRLELLKVPADECLVRALYGLLMLLPQTEAFQILQTRLSCIPSLHLHCDKRFCLLISLFFPQIHNISPKTCRNQTEIKPVPARMSNIDFPKLLKHFKDAQDNNKRYKKALRAKEVSSLDRDMRNLDV